MEVERQRETETKSPDSNVDNNEMEKSKFFISDK